MHKLTPRIRRPSAGTTIAMIALVLAMGGGGYAAFGKDSKAGAKFYGPNDYSPNDSRVGYHHEFVGQIVCTSSPFAEGDGTTFQLAFDNLPDGAAITKVTVSFVDTDDGEHLTFQPGFSTTGFSDLLEEFSEATSTTGPGSEPSGFQTLTMTPSSPVPVDNANRRYLMSAKFSACDTTDEAGNPTLALDGVRVDYTVK